MTLAKVVAEVGDAGLDKPRMELEGSLQREHVTDVSPEWRRRFRVFPN